MSSESMMTPAPVTLTPDRTVGEALAELLAHRQSAVPVVDREGRYLGMFGARDLIRALLPKGATLDDMLPDLSFVTEEMDDIRDRLGRILDHRIGRHVDESAPVVHPETPMMETLLLIYRSRGMLPVVERKTRRLLGVVSGSEALARIAGKA